MYRYVQIDENGKIKCYCDYEVEGVTIDTEGMTVPEQPTDAIYALYYNETDLLHWVKVADFESETPEPSQLDRIESMVSKSQEQIAQEAIDAYTLELIEGGVIA